MKLTWLNKNYKWLVPVLTIFIIITYLLASSNLGKTSTDLAQAYTDTELYQEAINKANRNIRVLELIGEIQPVGKMTILNGEVQYLDNAQKVTSTVKVQGSKDNAKLDLSAYRNGDVWVYELINLRIDKSGDNAQSIEIINPEKQCSYE